MRGIFTALFATTVSVAAVNTAAADQDRTASPSIVFLGSAQAPSAQTAGASVSIIALGEPGIEDMKVAAVAKKGRPAPMPMVIRGGVVGDAFSGAPAPSVALPASEAKVAPDVAAQPPVQANGTPAANPNMASAEQTPPPPSEPRPAAAMPPSAR